MSDSDLRRNGTATHDGANSDQASTAIGAEHGSRGTDHHGEGARAGGAGAIRKGKGRTKSGSSIPKGLESLGLSVDDLLEDYRLARLSREMSQIGRREVLTGKAKFGIFGDGKELPQIALAKFFRDGDFRSGYYRDQTLMMALGQLSPTEFFAQLYADPDPAHDPHSAGRQMTSHFSTQLVDGQGEWLEQTRSKNSAADLSPTAGQMPRMLGLAQASVIYRGNPELADRSSFSNDGNEVVFGTIGDASTSEGIFWETMNAAGVLQVPVVMSVWDDGFGISVPRSYQTVKDSISKALDGFRREPDSPGFEILTVKAWDYPGLLATYEHAARLARQEHVPVLVHVQEVTQPQGHSTSGSHERYKSAERLQWEETYCCCNQLRHWMLANSVAEPEELDQIEASARQEAREAQKQAWKQFLDPIQAERAELLDLMDALVSGTSMEPGTAGELRDLARTLTLKGSPIRRDVIITARQALMATRAFPTPARQQLRAWLDQVQERNERHFNSHLLSETPRSPLRVEPVAPEYAPGEPQMVDGRVVLRENFDKIFASMPEVVTFGEDTGRLGDVNLGMEGLQKTYGERRIFDTGIREATILGQGVGMALRGLRPIAEIQYLDYLLYCLQGLSDDVATLRYRTRGRQACPVIVRTRGHRLEGIWHSGSPMGMILNALRGVHVCVPRNLTEAAGFYNTLLRGDDPGLIIEPLNAYRLKEPLPLNPGRYTTPLGIPEVVREGSDVTLVSYGSTCNVVESALPQLDAMGISAELIDIRTLLPFDQEHRIAASLAKTGRIVFIDEDVPGGATAYMMQKVLDEQGGYSLLDSAPLCVTAREHRPAYATDGDYFSKPSVEDVVEKVYGLMRESAPGRFPAI